MNVSNMPQTELFDERAIGIRIAALEIIEEFAATADHAQQTSTRVVIFTVGLEVTGKLVDASSQEGYLNFGGPGIALNALELRDDVGLLDISDRHFMTSMMTGDRAEVP